MATPRYVTGMQGETLAFLIEALEHQRFRVNSRKTLLEAIERHAKRGSRRLSTADRAELMGEYDAARKFVIGLPEGESRLLAAMIDGWWVRATQEFGSCPGCHWNAAIHGKEGCGA